MSQSNNNFSQIEVSNVVGLFTLDNDLNMNAIFRLCTLDKIGDIKSISYQNFRRGTKPKLNRKKENEILKNGRRCWKNGLCIKMHDNISLKLSDNTMHITGCKSMEHAHLYFEELKDNFNDVEKNIKYVHDNMEAAMNCVKWIKEHVKGNYVYVIKNSEILVNPSDVVIYGPKIFLNIKSGLYKTLQLAHHLIPPRSNDQKIVFEKNGVRTEYQLIEVENFTTIKDTIMENPIADGCDPIIYNFFIDKKRDFIKYDEYIVNLDWFLSVDTLFKRGTELKQINFGYGNNNYNFKLNFQLNLKNVDSIFNKSEDFICEYLSEISKFATITHQIEIPDHLLPHIRKKEKAKLPKFVLYNTGSITQSSPHPELAELSRQKFMDIIQKNLDKLKSIDNK